MRIHIIGTSGSGKSTFARSLSKLLDIPHYDLDALYWDNEQEGYGIKMPADIRERRFQQILIQDAWIIEGVYYCWVREALNQADQIYLMDISRTTCQLRIMKRFLKRKSGLEDGRRESLKSLLEMLRWMKIDYRAKADCFKELEKKYPTKTVRLKTRKDIQKTMMDFRNGS